MASDAAWSSSGGMGTHLVFSPVFVERQVHNISQVSMLHRNVLAREENDGEV